MIRFHRRLAGSAALLGATLLAAAAAAGSGLAGGEEPRPTEAEIGSVQVYLTPDEALREIFEEAAGVDTVTAVLLQAERMAVEKTLGERLPSDTLVVLVPRSAGGGPLGYAVVAEEIGKYRPITFMVGTGPDLKVQNVEVLVYRESRGGEVRMSRFLRQYRGKSAENSIRINKDILNIAGATLSVNALNHGVKRVLLCLEALAARGAL